MVQSVWAVDKRIEQSMSWAEMRKLRRMSGIRIRVLERK